MKSDQMTDTDFALAYAKARELRSKWADALEQEPDVHAQSILAWAYLIAAEQLLSSALSLAKELDEPGEVN